MAVKVELSVEKVLEVAKTSESNKALMQALFPQVFEENEHYIKVGDLFIINDAYNTMYNVVLIEGNTKVAIQNIVSGTTWNKSLRVDSLYSVTSVDSEYSSYQGTRLSITKGEFAKLIGDQKHRQVIKVDANDFKNYLKHTGKIE